MVSRSGVAALDKGIAIAFALRLAAQHHRDAELVVIRWIEHQPLPVLKRGRPPADPTLLFLELGDFRTLDGDTGHQPLVAECETHKRQFIAKNQWAPGPAGLRLILQPEHAAAFQRMTQYAMIRIDSNLKMLQATR